MIRTKTKEPYKGLKRTPMKRKPLKTRTAKPPLLRKWAKKYPPKNRIKSPKKIGSVSLKKIRKVVAKNPPNKAIIKNNIKLEKWQHKRDLRIRIDPLDALVSEYVRKRTKGFCERCGKYYGWEKLQACHFHSRRKISVRYDSENIAGCDFGCHQYLDGNPLEKVQFFQNRLGQVKFDLLNSRARITYPKPDKKALTLYYQQQIKLLDTQNNA